MVVRRSVGRREERSRGKRGLRVEIEGLGGLWKKEKRVEVSVWRSRADEREREEKEGRERTSIVRL